MELGATERGMLLLCAALGAEGERPLSMREFRSLRQKCAPGAQALDLTRDVSAADLKRAGCAEDETERIMLLLGREARLERVLGRMEEAGIKSVTRLSPEYAYALWDKLGDSAPPVLFCAGNLELLRGEHAGLVGSRRLNDAGRYFAKKVGALAAEEGYTLVSGGAAGADSEAERAALFGGGSAAVFVADSLWDRLKSERTREELETGRLLIISEQSAFAPFSAARAHSRNRYIHIAGEQIFVAQSDMGFGGTWSGTVDNLAKGWSPVLVNTEGGEGARGLIERGGIAVEPEKLVSIRHLGESVDLRPAQTSLF